MSSPTTRFWLFWFTLIESFWAFFTGVYFSVWGGELSSPVWVQIMDGWHGPRFWGTLLLVSGGLFLLGLQWTRLWPRVIGCTITGLVYLVIGGYLAVVPFYYPDTFNGSVGMWFLGGSLTLLLAGFMWRERYNETQEDRIRDASRRQAHRKDH